MNSCKCGSYALNDAPETGLCDVCNQKAKVGALTAELAAVKAELAFAIGNAKTMMEQYGLAIAGAGERIASLEAERDAAVERGERLDGELRNERDANDALSRACAKALERAERAEALAHTRTQRWTSPRHPRQGRARRDEGWGIAAATKG